MKSDRSKRTIARTVLARVRGEYPSYVVFGVLIYALLLWLFWLLLTGFHGHGDFGGLVVPWVTAINVLWLVLLVAGVMRGGGRSRGWIRLAPTGVAVLILIGLQVAVHRQAGLAAKFERQAATFAERILFIAHFVPDAEKRSPRIGRVRINESWSRASYQGRVFESTLGHLSLRDRDTGDRYFFARPRPNGADGWPPSGVLVRIDDDVREEYWTKIRKRPDLKSQTSYRTENPHVPGDSRRR